MKINKLIFPAIGAALSLLNANAATIFDGTTTNVNLVANSSGPSVNSISGTTGALVVNTISSSNLSSTGIAGMDDINTLNGSALVATDVVTMQLTVSSITGANDITGNGIEFGISPNGTGFRPSNTLMLRLPQNGTTAGMSLNNVLGLATNVAGWAPVESSLVDGFGITLVADNSGFIFTLTDIQEVGNITNTTLSYSSTFTGTQFVDNFGGGHIYFTRQGGALVAGSEVDVNISEFSIDVSPIPEPSAALLSFLGLAGFLRRRRA